MLLTDRDVGRDIEKIRFPHIFDSLFQQPLHDASLDWHGSRVHWHHYIHRISAKDTAESAGAIENRKSSIIHVSHKLVRAHALRDRDRNSEREYESLVSQIQRNIVFPVNLEIHIQIRSEPELSITTKKAIFTKPEQQWRVSIDVAIRSLKNVFFFILFSNLNQIVYTHKFVSCYFLP